MACPATVLEQLFHVRSISMPSRTQPVVLRIEKELQELRTCVASSSYIAPQMICNRPRELGDVYDSIEMMLPFLSNKQAVSQNNQKEWVEKELDQSVKVLDLCTVIRESMVAMKEHAQDLALARRRRDAFPEGKLQAFVRSRKKARKEIKNCIRSLKNEYSKYRRSLSTLDKDSDGSIIARMLIEAREIMVSLLVSIFSFSSRLKTERTDSKWPFISKATKQRKVASQDELEYVNEMESFVLLETGLDYLFKRLIRNRVSLLYIISL